MNLNALPPLAAAAGRIQSQKGKKQSDAQGAQDICQMHDETAGIGKQHGVLLCVNENITGTMAFRKGARLALRIYKSKWFVRFAKKERIADARLCEAIENAEKGLIDADYGDGLIKQRIARPGEGKSGGYRSIILFRAGELGMETNPS